MALRAPAAPGTGRQERQQRDPLGKGDEIGFRAPGTKPALARALKGVSAAGRDAPLNTYQIYGPGSAISLEKRICHGPKGVGIASFWYRGINIFTFQCISL